MSNIERILKTAKSDARLQTIITNYFQRIGYPQSLVSGLTFKETKTDSPAFCLGVQILNMPIGVILVSEELSKSLTQEELEFVVLHEMGHIMNNHFVGASFIWLTKSWIIDIIADVFEVSKKKANEYLSLAKVLYILWNKKRTAEEEAKATFELEADKLAIITQGQKEHARSTFIKLSNGNVRAPTHVTVDGQFPFPIITYEERINAIERA